MTHTPKFDAARELALNIEHGEIAALQAATPANPAKAAFLRFVLAIKREEKDAMKARIAEADARLAEMTSRQGAKEQSAQKQSIANACQILKNSTDPGERAEAAITLSAARQSGFCSRPQEPEMRVGTYETAQPPAAPMTNQKTAPMTRETLLQIIPRTPEKSVKSDYSKTAKHGIPGLAKILQITGTNSIKGKKQNGTGAFQIRAAFISQILEAGITEQDAREIAAAGWFVSEFDALEIVIAPMYA